MPEHSQCLENESRVEKGDGDAKSEGLKERKDREENEVGGMAVALPEEQTEDNEGSEQGHIERPQAAETMSDTFDWRVHITH